MRRAALLGAVAAFAVVPAAEAGGTKAATNVTIDAAFATIGETQWAGDISSRRKACENNRPVAVFRVRSGTDQRIGQTRSFKGKVDNNYYWVLAKPGSYPSGKYYAKVKPTSKCKGDRSKNLASDF